MEEYTDATNRDMCKRGIPTIKDLLHKILEMQAELLKNSKQSSERLQPSQGCMPKLWLVIRPGKVLRAIRRLCDKVPDGWYKNPYAWTGIICTVVFFAMFIASWVQWHEYRDENIRLKMVADKHQVTSVMLNELHPKLAITVGAYEKLVETVGVDSTLTIFNQQVKTMREANNQFK